MRVYWATKLRGFLRHISEGMDAVEFAESNQYYEVSGKSKQIKSKLIRSRLFDCVGLFQIIRISGKQCDCYGSFNRFLKSDKPYFIYLENPTALYNYALGRIDHTAGKKRFQKCLNDPNLKYIVCMSEACRSTFDKVNMPLPAAVRLETIYPFVPSNPLVSEKLIHEKSHAESLECLFCVQGKSFYTKGGRDVLEAVVQLQDAGCNIHLTVITNLDMLKPETLEFIRSKTHITLHDFRFTYEQMEEIYAKTAVLLQPTSADSFGLTVLEAVKAGCAVLGSRLYALPEMVEHNGNGILIDPMYWTFTPDHMPNPIAWGYEKKVKLSEKKSQKYVDDIRLALRTMYEDRELLQKFCIRSAELANTKFGEDVIRDQWKAVWDVMKRKEDNET